MTVRKQYTSKQIQGYRNNLAGEIRADRTGSRITLDLTIAKALLEILDNYAIAALPAQPAHGEAVARCGYCDGTGDVVRIDGEWLGKCHCPAGTPTPPDSAELDALVVRASKTAKLYRNPGLRDDDNVADLLDAMVAALRAKGVR